MPVAAEAPARIALEWVRPPQQARSHKTLIRILDAAEELIEEGGVEAVTIAAVIGRGSSSVGAFYARFGDKENLLRCVFERFFEQAQATALASLAPDRWGRIALREILETALAFTADVFRQRRRIIAAMVAQAAARPELVAAGRDLGDAITTGLLGLARARGLAPRHPEPERAASLCVWLVLGALTSWAQVGADDGPPTEPAAFAAETVEMFFGYLFAGQPEGGT